MKAAEAAELFRRAASIAQELLLHPPEARQDRLDDILGAATGSPSSLELRRRVEVLLATFDTFSEPTEPAGQVRSDEPDPEPARVAGDRIGPYRVLKLLGKGGMGRVYLAERADGEVERQVAIKVLADRRQGHQTHQRFLAERQILAGLDHPNIARMFDAGTTDDGRSFLVMEAVDGSPIDVFCREQGWSLDQRLELFRQVASAVGHAHQRLVVHRDLKPSNILVDTEGNPKLLDFGIAKLLQPESPAGELTRTGQQLMTPAWASPEQLKAEPITTATDVYALGLLLYKMLTGRLPHDPSESLFDLARRGHETAPPRRPSEHLREAGERTQAHWLNHDLRRVTRQMSGDLDNIILKALRHDPADRYASVDALLEDLRRLKDGEPVTATRDTFFYLARKFVGRYRVPVGVLIAFLVLCLGFVAETRRQSLKISEEARRTQEAKDFLAQLIGAADRESRSKGNVDLKAMLDAGLERIRNGEIEDPQIKAELLVTLGDGYRDLKLYPNAAALFIEAEELFSDQGDLEDLYLALGRRIDLLVLMDSAEEARNLSERGFALGAELGKDTKWIGRLVNQLESRPGLALSRLYQDLEEMSAAENVDPDAVWVPFYRWLGSLVDGGIELNSYQNWVDLLKLCKGRSCEERAWDSWGRRIGFGGDAKRCAVAYILQKELQEAEGVHFHAPVVALNRLSLGACLGEMNRFDEATVEIEAGLNSTRQLLEVSPGNLRARYHVGLAHQYRAVVFEEMGDRDRFESESLEAKRIFEGLLPEHQGIIYIRNAYVMTLLMLDEIEAAKPLVEDLLWEGWRRPDFMRLAKQKNALPEMMPPRLDVETELPPKLKAYIDTLPEVPMPWEEEQAPSPSVSEPRT